MRAADAFCFIATMCPWIIARSLTEIERVVRVVDGTAYYMHTLQLVIVASASYCLYEPASLRCSRPVHQPTD
jgi:hypothetical protein